MHEVIKPDLGIQYKCFLRPRNSAKKQQLTRMFSGRAQVLGSVPGTTPINRFEEDRPASPAEVELFHRCSHRQYGIPLNQMILDISYSPNLNGGG
jgi:hypothetical protein